jgi:N-acetylglucosaminyldiphosphoundecaprenol N-acetyl-beta-D-mannosaminyltransferase
MEKTIEIAGIPIDNVTVDETLALVERRVASGGQAHWVTVNPEMLLRASTDQAFQTLLRNAALRTPDGVGILWAAHYLTEKPSASALFSRLHWLLSLFSILFSPRRVREPLRERVTGTDLLARIADRSQERPWTLYLLGAEEGVAEKAVSTLSKAYPQAKFVGSFSGSPNPDYDDETVHRINLAQPALLFVAYGSPAQEQWIQRNLARLPSVRVAIGVGGAFDFHSGAIRRAPRWAQTIGLEWLWRLLREPRRLGRIWNAAVVFPEMIYRQKQLTCDN